ncbi:hypothetical protein [Nakamurella deserti]|uniref:hypothetical protein n=1 Tax=Nakamurella deserti TaxID=2164074 RepID=UPI000DBE7ECA|nr:hypothetical protein [Nakamurella deserti]
MRTPRLLSLSAAVLLSGAVLVGCGSSDDTARSTVIVTETAATSAVDTTADATADATAGTTTAGTGATSGAVETSDPSTSASETSTGSSTSEASASATESSAPVVSVDPLAADCTKIMNPTELGKAFGQLPAGTNRILEAANPEREITGRLKCQYGVEGGSIAVQVILAQFTSQQAADAQRTLTATSERQAGAKDSTTTVLGYPADVLLRDGGLIVAGYDSWTLSVVVANGIVPEDKLPAALEGAAEYALNQVVSTG